jgi:hypothetical protein
MFESKQMILDQRRGSAKDEAGGYKQRKRPPCGGPNEQSIDSQLFSLLARFQEMSSPIVELVLETGCL